MGPSHRSSIPDRVATYAVVVGLILCLAHLAGALTERDVVRGIIARLGVGLAMFAGGAGVAWVGRRAGAATSRVNDLSRHLSAVAADRTSENREILARLGGIALAVKEQAAERDAVASEALRRRPLTPLDAGIVEPLPEPAPTAATAPPPPAFDPALAERIIA